ncbi:hypothetical protein CEXT_768791 [Caerostris extrusa]|uniref:Uncharacterized protein n=1 Tax=Caerostris extrusa TaxID=172846 RepID=A0AAV4XN88_CAEEX|nr:hypothetical protein CEXT_768791 [Caerostris extrusa]
MTPLSHGIRGCWPLSSNNSDRLQFDQDIRKEVAGIENGISDLEINVLRMAHHTQRFFEFGTEENKQLFQRTELWPPLQMCVHESAVG